METATYRLYHHASDSMAFAEFGWVDGHPKLMGISFARGNVLDLVQYMHIVKTVQAYFVEKFWGPSLGS